jgi:subtilase family serine protease
MATNAFNRYQRRLISWDLRASRSRSTEARRASRFAVRVDLELLENRVALTGNIAIANAFLVNAIGGRLTSVSPGEQVYVQADFNTQGLPIDASYDVAYTVNGLTLDSRNLADGAGVSGTAFWQETLGYFVASPGENQIAVTVDPDDSVRESSYADNTISFSFDAAENLSYTVSQIRDAYGINSIPNFGSATADGSGQTIAIVDAYDDPMIRTDLDGFDQAMHLSTNLSPTLYQQYGPASSILTVFNQAGTNITNEINNGGVDGVPQPPPSGTNWNGEETLDVEWAHAIAPGAHIDLIECTNTDGLFSGAANAAQLPGVTVVSMSWGVNERNHGGINKRVELAYDSTTFVTPRGHPGVTYLASTGDTGLPGGYPAYSPNVVAVGGTQLSLNGATYRGETGWSFPSPRTVDSHIASYDPRGGWIARLGSRGGTYRTTAVQGRGSATWTTTILSTDQGHAKFTEVSATWVPKSVNATNAKYRVYDGSPTTTHLVRTVTVDQRKAPVGTNAGGAIYQELGVFFIQSGNPLTVVLSARSADGTVVADSIGVAPARASSGGPSQYETEPSYQRPFQDTGFRTTPDVSFDGSNRSGVTLFENGRLSYENSGTSLSAPCWAGLIAIVNQGRVAKGGTSLNGTRNPQQTLEALYSLPGRDFHDIDSGYNGRRAHSGYDEVTGRGSPITNLLVPALARYDLPGRHATSR